MVTKMEKFTSLQYDDLIKEINKIYKNNALINDIKVLPEAKVIDQLRNWVEYNSYNTVKDLINSNEGLSETFLNIFRTIKIINNSILNNQMIEDYLKKLKLYYNALQLSVKNKNTKDSLEKEANDLLINNYSKADSIKADIEKLEKEVDSLKSKLKECADIDVKYNNSINEFDKYLDENKQKIDSKVNECVKNCEKDIEQKYGNLNNRYVSLEKTCISVTNNIFKRLNDMPNAAAREELAHYFLNERKKLKGDINLNLLIFSVFLVIIYRLWSGDDFINSNNIYSIQDVFNINLFVDLSLFVFEFFIVFCVVQSIYFYNKKKKPQKQMNTNSEQNKMKDDLNKQKTPEDEKGYEINERINEDFEYFQELKNLLTPYWCWLGLTFAGMFCILRIAYVLFILNLQNLLPTEPYKILANLPFFMILVWFTWFCSKQFSYTKQICDEYEYKYALSKSYLSYRDEARKASDSDKNKYDAIIISLLDSVIKNIATSPIKSVKPDCHTPFTEIFGSLKDVMKHTENKE